MKNIYKGKIKKMYISNFNITKSGLDLFFNEKVVCKNSYFYKNAFGNIVNIEYDNVLATREEAREFVKENSLDILFVDYDEIKAKEPKLLEIVKDGWDGIDKNILVVDLPEENKERGYISRNTKEVLEAYNCFQKLKEYSKNLKEVLKWI